MPDSFKNELFELNNLSADTPFGILNDDTKLETYLRLSTKVFENSLEGICITKRDGTIILVNDSFSKITGYSKSEAIGNNPRILKSGHHPDRFYKSMWNTLRTEGKWIGEFRNRRKNGENYIQRTTVCSLTDENGNVTNYASLITDITEEKSAEESLLHDLNLAKEIQKNVLSSPMKNNQISINGVNIPSKDLAGDMYVWYQISENKYGIILIDVMGHGVASSLICMSIRSLLSGLIKKVTDPKNVIEELQMHMRSLYSKAKGRTPFYFTAIYLVIDTKQKEIEYINAGHLPGLIRTNCNEIQLLHSNCTSVGLFPFINAHSKKIQYDQPLTIFLYTDGFLDEKASLNNEIDKVVANYQKLSNDKDADIISSFLKLYDENQFSDDVSAISITIF